MNDFFEAALLRPDIPPTVSFPLWALVFFCPVSTKIFRDGRHDLKITLRVAPKPWKGVIGDSLITIIPPGLTHWYLHSG